MPAKLDMDWLEIEVRIAHPDWRRALRAPAALCRAAAEAALATGRRPGRRQGDKASSVAFLLTDDTEMRRLNQRYRGKNKPTNVLSFPAMPEEAAIGRAVSRHLGDIALALETVRREAKEQGKTVRSHVSHLAVHGVLHLIGHDHQNDAEAEAMEALERRILAGLGIADPYNLPAHRLSRDDH